MINLYITSYSLISRYVSVYHGREDHCRGASPLHRKMNHGQCVTNMSLAYPLTVMVMTQHVQPVITS